MTHLNSNDQVFSKTDYEKSSIKKKSEILKELALSIYETDLKDLKPISWHKVLYFFFLKTFCE
jgi:hypothetical protein